MSLFYTIWNTFRRRIMAYRFVESVLFSFFKKRSALLGTIFLVSLIAVACSDTTPSTGGSTTVVQTTVGPSTLSSLHWCGKPAMVFRDQAAPATATSTAQSSAQSTVGLGPANGTPTTVTDWNVVKNNLGFTIFLPKTLPAGSCLLNVSGSLRDPIFGSNFTITYVLPDQSSISFSQAPSRTQSTGLQCSVSGSLASDGNATPVTSGTAGATGVTPTPTNNSTQLCNGVREKTNIVFSARGTTAALEQFFQALQPDVDWVPAK